MSDLAAATRARFERELHSRTLAYLPGFADDGRPVEVVLGADAHCPAGHALASCLTNLLSRAHRRVHLVGDFDAVLLCRSPFGCSTIGEATIGTARAINPFVEVEISDSIRRAATQGESLIIGVGHVPAAHLCLGTDGFVADLGPDARIVDRPASLWGALLASCLGANAAFHWAARRDVRVPVGRFSLWALGERDGSDGPRDPGPIDVGRVLQAGIGAVGCGLGLAVVIVGTNAEWTIVDRDEIDVSNLNRQVLFLAQDAGWPMAPAAGKAPTAARRIALATGANIRPEAHWYADSPASTQTTFDVILALANDGGVRSDLQARQPTVLLHATTSAHWQAQAHRHVAGRDDCIDCRIAPDAGRMRCSTGRVEETGPRMDAALPFLSMTAGLLVAAQMIRLQHGALLDRSANQTVIDLAGPEPGWLQAVRTCRGNCRVRLPRDTRQELDASSRWVVLDR